VRFAASAAAIARTASPRAADRLVDCMSAVGDRDVHTRPLVSPWRAKADARRARILAEVGDVNGVTQRLANREHAMTLE